MSQRESGTEARQGERGKPTLVALIVGLVVAVAIGAAILSYQGSRSPADPSSHSLQGSASGPAGSNGAASGERPANQSSPSREQPKP